MPQSNRGIPMPQSNYIIQQRQMISVKQEDTILAQTSNSRNEALAIKARHLAAENYSLRETLHSIEAQVTSLRTVNEELTRSNPQSVQLIINQLSKQNLNLEKSLFRELKNNEKIACDLLMNNQLLLENENEFRDIIASYQVKIYDLRVNLQTKEAFFSNAEDKLLAERDELYNLPNRANMTYFNEMNELKLLIERHIIENTELQLVVIQKNEDLEASARQLKICEGVLKVKEEWSQYQQKLQVLSANTSSRTRATDNKARIKIEQELTRYDAKYKYITWHNNRRSDLSAQIYELKMFISKLLRDNRLKTEEKSMLHQKLTAKEQELQQVREAVSHLQKDLFQQKIEGEFYRFNFKELTKVTTERKIRFYQEHYPQSLPNLEQRLIDKSEVIKYWKHWHRGSHEGAEFTGKIAIRGVINKVKSHKRSNSCCIRFSHTEANSGRGNLQNEEKEEGIFSFINMEHETTSALGYTFEEASLLRKEDPQIFDGQLSIIAKPAAYKRKQTSNPFQKKEEILEQI